MYAETLFRTRLFNCIAIMTHHLRLVQNLQNILGGIHLKHCTSVPDYPLIFTFHIFGTVVAPKFCLFLVSANSKVNYFCHHFGDIVKNYGLIHLYLSLKNFKKLFAPPSCFRSSFQGNRILGNGIFIHFTIKYIFFHQIFFEEKHKFCVI